jgi:predicted nucleotidyltransferase
MDREAVITKLHNTVEAVRGLGATSLHMFGSTARGEAGPESDVDVFVEYDLGKTFSLFNLAGIKILLEEELGVPVDITTRDSLHPLLRDRIEASAVRIF